jgi:4-hydroxybenzoate polyprenyltransferase
MKHAGSQPSATPSQTGKSAGPGVILAGWPRLRRDIRAWLLLPHFTPVLVVLTATLGFSMLARNTVAIDSVTLRLMMAMLGGQLAIGAVNELVDADLDAVSKPAKPIPAGIISRAAARNLAVLSLLMMIWFSVSFGVGSLVLCALGTGAGLVYDLWLKRTLLSWLPYLVALPLVPIWVWTAADRWRSELLILYPLGALAVIGVHLSQAVPDTVADRDAGIRSISTMLGERRALALCWSSTLTAPVLASILAPRLTDWPGAVWIASVVVTALVLANAAVYFFHRRVGIATCFPVTSLGTVLMGLTWVLASR